MKTEVEGSVRVDLLGGTLDLNPINMILPKVVTLNVATSLTAKVLIEDLDETDVIEIESKDYNSKHTFYRADFTSENFHSNFFGALSFVLQIISLFESHKGLRVTLESDAPAGSGLGGSSAMAATLYKALCQHHQQKLDRELAIRIVNGIEGRILNAGPAGYQDYYPALYGGVLALIPEPGHIKVEQLYTEELAKLFDNNISLIYSGETRHSGINNWEVYKAFFDGNQATRHGLAVIAELSHKAYLCLVNQEYDQLFELIKKEGEERVKLFPGIVSSKMESLYNKLRLSHQDVGLKVCGAGGGGCFLLVHEGVSCSEISKEVKALDMKILPLSILPPLP
jgi:D-glycero-alpha-D-manno-heptose-7-phosphate kinase